MDFLKRFVTACILLPIVIAIIHYGGPLFAGTIFLAGLVLGDEIFCIGFGKKHPFRIFFRLTAAVFMFFVVANVHEYQVGVGAWLFLFLFALCLTFKPKLDLAEISKAGLVISISLYAFMGLASFFYLRTGVHGDEILGRSFLY